MAKSKNMEISLFKKLTQVSTMVKVVIPLFSVFGLMGAAVLWLFSTFATQAYVEAADKRIAGQVEDIKKAVKEQGNEVKIFILEGRRELLVKEKVGLEGKRARTSDDNERLGVIKEQILRIDRQLEVLERQQANEKK